MILILQKPTILCDHSGNFKSWNYLRHKLFYDKIHSPNELICLPTILVLCSLVAFILAKNLVNNEQN